MRTTGRTFIFVYGTLKQGAENHAQITDQRYVGTARTTPGFSLYSLGQYPGLVADPADSLGVSGELWSVDAACLARLDAFEGVNEKLYARVPAPLAAWPKTLTAIDAKSAWMYLYLRDVSRCPKIGDEWPVLAGPAHVR